MKKFITAAILVASFFTATHAYANEAKLIAAAKSGNLAKVQELISGGLDPETSDSSDRTIAMIAAQNGKFKVVDYLLDLDVNPNRKDKKGYTLMHILAASKSKDAVPVTEKAIEQRGSINLVMGKGDTPLSLAIKNGNADMVRLFLEKGDCTPDSTVYRMPIALYAYSEGRAEVMKIIVEKGAKLETYSSNGYTLLNYAVKKNDLATVQYLASKGASLETTYNSMTPLLYSVQLGNYKVMQFLIDSGADVTRTDQEGMSVLHILAAGKNNGKTISGMNIPDKLLNKKDREGRPPIVVAVINKRWDSVKALTDKGADTGYTDTEGRSLLFMSLEGGSYETVSMFMDKGLSITRANSRGVTPLHLTAGLKGKNWDALMLKIIQSGADVNAGDDSGGSAAGMAIDSGNAPGFRILCDNGLNLNFMEKGSEPLVMYAYRKNQKVIMNELIQRGASLAARDSAGNTMLHAAAEKNDTAFFKSMQQGSYDLNIKNSLGKTPLLVAVEKGSVAFAQLLIADREHLDLGARDNQGMSLLHYLAPLKGGDKLLAMVEADQGMVRQKDNTGRSPLSIAVNAGLTANASYFLLHGADASGEDQNGLELVVTGYEKSRAMLNLLLDNGADPNAMNPDGKNLLFIAIEKSDLDTLKLLVQKNTDINRKYLTGKYPLIHAIYKRNGAVIRFLIDSGANTNIKDESGNTPLVAAVESKDIQVTEYLVKGGADVNVTNSAGKKLLVVAYDKNSLEIFTQLISGGAQVNELFDGQTMLHVTVTANKLSFVNALVKGGADLNAKNREGRTPLMITAEKGFSNGAKLLLGASADFNVKDNAGETALFKAVKINSDGSYAVADLILKAGAKADDAGGDGKPALLQAAEAGGYGFVSLLLKYGANPNTENQKKETVIYILSKTIMTGAKDKWKSDRAAKVIAEVVAKGGDANRADKYGRTPLDLACRVKNTVIIEALLKNGALVDTQDANGNTPLKKVVMDYTGDYKFSDKEKKAVLGVIDLLIKNGARIDVQDKFGRTPLTHIVKEANEKNRQKVFDIVPELLGRGARTDIADSDGKTAADYARSGIAGLSDLVR